MKRLEEIHRTTVPDGSKMVLYRRGTDFLILLDGLELMGSRAHASEEQLAVLGCAGLRTTRGARVLIGGLGMGYSVRSALSALADDAEVDVAELVPAVVHWNRGPLAHLAGAPLDDHRVRILEEDVADVIDLAQARYDAILLDVDNGPAALSSPVNRRLYDAAGLARARRALRAGGVLAVWSRSDDSAFTKRLARAGFAVRQERPTAHAGGGGRHVVWLGRAPG